MTLITPEMRQYIGAELPAFELEIHRKDLQKYAVATGQTLPHFINGDQAPLLYLFTAMMPVLPMAQLMADGHPPDNPLIPPLPLKRIMAGGSEYEIHRPIYAGDVLVCRQKLLDMYEKTGAQGPLIFLVFENRFQTRDGQAVVTERLTRIAR